MNSNDEIINKAVLCLGRGFDLTSDFRLKFCKGEERLVYLNETEKKELIVPGFGSIHGVSPDIKCDKGDRTRYQSDILDFHQMSELFNLKAAVPGKIPSGQFNRIFGFDSGSWAIDAANTRYLGLDGYFIVLFNVHIHRYPLVLSDEVRNAVPSSWDPCALARFIEKYGTHVVVGLSIGGKDIVVVRQEKSSNLDPSQLKKHLDDLGDQLFTGTCNFSPNARDHRSNKAPQAFNVFDPQPLTFNSYSSVNFKDGIMVICAKKGGDTSITDHGEWLQTVASKPDAIHFNLIPITSLLNGAPGKGFLSHAINLYLRYKPPISDLQYFLEFQSHKIWAPVHNDLPLGPSSNLATSSPALQFSLMGPKLYVNTSQVNAGKRPVTGMRFYLEGMKCNRLAIHLQHLSTTPKMFENKIAGTSFWRGSEDVFADNEAYFEATNRNKFSHVCTAPVKYDPTWNPTKDDSASYIVTGAKLHIKKHNTKRHVLHLRLLFSKVSDAFIAQSTWAHGPSHFSQKSGLFSAISTSLAVKEKPLQEQQAVVVDSSVYPTGPPTAQAQKLLKVVDTSQLCKGPQDSPGHWLVTGARLQLDKGKICLQVKFSLLNIRYRVFNVGLTRVNKFISLDYN